ncbi:YlmC/YmxH family sporulation protein [Desulfohalotomaculum tongense]|uniref:YlmC/YmxH family sporulation protein n=1 Tax=Desulforadius tongensis TaxID=1216062 RepID=UPI00195B53AC|nr:YlmC/YmxH family sporulation protein [Desulforadius tongensis]MBM7855228.1 YlmC/YmxH family sporulation protein [Desulforadius tongensis]
MVKVSELRTREIVNVVDGRRLGVIKDIDIDMEQGKISALILPAPGRVLGFLGREEEFVVPWDKIVKIGMDVILVEVNAVAGNRRDLIR